MLPLRCVLTRLYGIPASSGSIQGLFLYSHYSPRYERVTLCQRLGFETRHRFHMTNWEEVAKDSYWINMPQPLWQYDQDVEAYAVERWDEVRAYIQDGDETKAFRPTNIAPGHVHTDWTVAELTKLGATMAKLWSGWVVGYGTTPSTPSGEWETPRQSSLLSCFPHLTPNIPVSYWRVSAT
jgi:hypothetical protein